MKTCFKCGASKPLTEFYKHSRMKDGFLNKCKECAKRDTKENRTLHADYYRQYDRDRFQTDPKVRERHRRYQKTENGKKSIRETRLRWLERNLEKRAAHIILGNRIRKGEVVKPDACSCCGKGGIIHGHHSDYSRPLDVEWLCPACHVGKHRF